ncbi:DUF6332 family protein [Kribbella solani]|uniref:DUF6332 family protein n=1 Tax=Kribbella solani TaxID=236067 RepID=UPI0029B11F78|nr:DUF6332 family protein [Kribbella solani]MDX2973945.1 DUF6332 family protein [Kribbella solani]
MNKYTGWTRAELVELADRSLLALRPWATPGHARFDLPGPAESLLLKAGIVLAPVVFLARVISVLMTLPPNRSDPADQAAPSYHPRHPGRTNTDS